MLDTTETNEALIEHYRDLLMRHFLENRRRVQNPDGVFLFYFNDRQKDQHERSVLEILRRLGRETVTLDRTGLTARDIYRKASNTDGNTRAAYEAFERMLLNENMAFVFKDISRSNMSYRFLPGVRMGLDLAVYQADRVGGCF